MTAEFTEREQAILLKLARQEELHTSPIPATDESGGDFTKPESMESSNIIFLLDCKQGVTHVTILSMFGVFFANFTFSSYCFFILIFFLEDPASHNMNPDQALGTAAWLVFIGYLFGLAANLANGPLMLRYGRRKVILTGFLLGITAIFLVPFIGRTIIYPNVMIMVVIMNIGSAWTANPPLIADYVRPNSIGKAYAI